MTDNHTTALSAAAKALGDEIGNHHTPWFYETTTRIVLGAFARAVGQDDGLVERLRGRVKDGEFYLPAATSVAKLERAADQLLVAADRIEALEVACAVAQEALREVIGIAEWMSGSPSFSPEGEAHIGWIKARDELAACRTALSASPSDYLRVSRKELEARIAALKTVAQRERDVGWAAGWTGAEDEARADELRRLLGGAP